MSRLRLADEDRERLGCPEWLENVDEIPRLREIRALHAAGGDYGNWPMPGVKMEPENTAVWVWMALYRNGVTPPSIADLDFSYALTYDPSPGKATSSPGGKRTRTRSGAGRGGASTRRSKAS